MMLGSDSFKTTSRKQHLRLFDVLRIKLSQVASEIKVMLYHIFHHRSYYRVLLHARTQVHTHTHTSDGHSDFLSR